eukprot:649213-Pelagomonas_calceolata.AAC.7
MEADTKAGEMSRVLTCRRTGSPWSSSCQDMVLQNTFFAGILRWEAMGRAISLFTGNTGSVWRPKGGGEVVSAEDFAIALWWTAAEGLVYKMVHLSTLPNLNDSSRQLFLAWANISWTKYVPSSQRGPTNSPDTLILSLPYVPYEHGKGCINLGKNGDERLREVCERALSKTGSVAPPAHPETVSATHPACWARQC